jgi:hypothetical protein
MGLVELWRNLGPGLAGAVFGAGWWFWVDAVACSQDVTVPFLHYLPGIFASLAALMFNCVRQDELQDYSPFDDGEACRYFQLPHFQQFAFLAFPESSAVCWDIYVILISSKCFLP